MDLSALEKQTVGAAVSKMLKHAGVQVNEQALAECGMDMAAPMQQEEKERYSLTITSKDRTITVSTTDPEDVLHMMKLGGMQIDSHEVTPMTVGGGGAGPAGAVEVDVPVTDITDMIDVLGGGESEHEEHEEHESEEEEEKEHDVEEAKEPFANSPATTNNSTPRVVGNTEDFGMTGTGEGNDQYGKRRAPGQGDNPMGWADMEESYKSFKAQKISEAKKQKPDFLDVDKDGNKEEPMKKALKDKEGKEDVKESQEQGLFAESLSLLKKYAGI